MRHVWGRMNWDKIKGALITIAPGLAAAIGTPAAGAAVAALIKVLGLSDPNEAQVIEAVANATPEQIEAVKRLDLGFRTRLAEIELERELAPLRLDQADRANARQREIQTKDNTPKILAAVLTVGFFGVLFYMLSFGIAEEGRDITLGMVVTLSGSYGLMLNYFYGSSSGSARKTEAIVNRIAERHRRTDHRFDGERADT